MLRITLLKALQWIRKEGLRHRMPYEGIRCDLKKSRKDAQETAKCCCAFDHAGRHRDLITATGRASRSETEYSQRIIGARKADNADKILSAHEPDIDVIVRGKAGN